MNNTTSQPHEDFSLVLGGPLYQLFLRFRLSRPSLELLHRRIFAFAMVTWLPLLVLSVLAGQAIGGVAVPFFRDLSAHARFLVALPLMIAAEVVVNSRISAIVAQFNERGLIAPEDQPKFERAIASAFRLRNSIVVEVIMLLLAFTLGYWVWARTAVLHVPTWYGRDLADGTRQLTPAGYWYAFLSLPVFRFILMRWYFRLLIWYRFIWSVSRIKLQLNPLHPDRCGGLGFIAGSAAAFLPVLVAQSALFSGVLGERILHGGAKLPEYDAEIGVFVVSLIAVALAPLCCFAPQLQRARRAGIRRYGLLASRYVDDFQNKWLPPAVPPAGESLLGAADIQSLADLGNSFEVVREMQTLPFGRKVVVQLAVMILLPIAPLMLTMFPLRELIERLMKMAV